MAPFVSRRHFLQTGAAVTAAATLPISSVSQAADSASDGKFRTAHIGVGGMGLADLNSIKSHPNVQVVALCDIDANFLNTAAAANPGAKLYRDFRVMLEEMKDEIDGVVVSTPDHTHAPASMTALNLGKPVYCQKPLTHDIYEARQLRLVADKLGLATQMGTQIHSFREYREAFAAIQQGVIGKVSKVYAWRAGHWGYDGGPFTNIQEPPETVEWNLWLGTAAERPYVPEVYHPFFWRRLIDFGTGTLGDMGVHIFDTPYGSLELTAPNWVMVDCREPTGIGHPTQMIVEYEFPGTQYTTDTLLWKWMDGDAAPPRSEDVELEAGIELPPAASLFIGEKGSMLLQHIAPARFFPAEKFADYQMPDVGANDHYHQWVDACQGKGETSCPFSYGGPLTEALLLGIVGARFPGQKLEWDAEKLEVTNIPEANQLIRRSYRQGFEVPNL